MFKYVQINTFKPAKSDDMTPIFTVRLAVNTEARPPQQEPCEAQALPLAAAEATVEVDGHI